MPLDGHGAVSGHRPAWRGRAGPVGGVQIGTSELLVAISTSQGEASSIF